MIDYSNYTNKQDNLRLIIIKAYHDSNKVMEDFKTILKDRLQLSEEDLKKEPFYTYLRTLVFFNRKVSTYEKEG